jgi:hypothetical protein
MKVNIGVLKSAIRESADSSFVTVVARKCIHICRWWLREVHASLGAYDVRWLEPAGLAILAARRRLDT